MINLEELSLFLPLARSDSNYIDGVQLRDDLLQSMPRLNKFHFSIDTAVIKNRSDLVLSSNVDIQRSFIDGQLGSVGSHVDVFAKKNRSQSHVYSLRHDFHSRCHIYSLPYKFTEFFFLSNSFQSGTFERVRALSVTDFRPFEPEFFRIISQSFPLLTTLFIFNDLPQECTQQPEKLIAFPRFHFLHVTRAHVDYATQFLVDERCQLPRLQVIEISWSSLMSVTQDCTKAATRLTCSRLKSLCVHEPFVRPACFHQYFSSL
jgi:hypothetical protein